MAHKTNRKKVLLALPAIVVLLVMEGCREGAWEEHCGADDAPNATLLETLGNDGRFSRFAHLLHQFGCDSLLLGSQTFTIFAPTDDAIDEMVIDSDLSTRFFKNHIARFVWGWQDLADTSYVRVKMLSGKYQELTRDADGIHWAGIALDGQPIACSDGVIWPMGRKAEYYDNLWELLEHGVGTYDSLFHYIQSFDEISTLKSAIEMGENAKGQKLYYHNEWMKRYGSINLEDSLYTAILPTNVGWTAAINEIAPYFRTYGSLIQDKSVATNIIVKRTYEEDTPLADSLQAAHTREALTRNLLFHRKVDFANLPGDSISSTAGRVFHSPSYLIDGMKEQRVSNGICYPTDCMKHKPEESFLETICVEAEQSSGRAMNFATVTTRSAAESNLRDVVSGMSYLEVINTSTSNLMQPQVQFDIPDVLAAPYDIYAVFVPALAFDTCAVGYRAPDTLLIQRDTLIAGTRYEAGDEAIIRFPYYDADSTKVCFYINYVHEGTDAAGLNMYEDKKIEADPLTGEPFVTKGYEVTKFLVAKSFCFPYANFSSSAFAKKSVQPVTTKIRVATNLTTNDKKTLGYTMRLDCLMLVPAN